jgi:hypothetical protein
VLHQFGAEPRADQAGQELTEIGEQSAVAPTVDRGVNALRRKAVVTGDGHGVPAHGAASVRGEPLLGLGQGARQADDIRQPRRAVCPRVDARMEASLVQAR